MDGKVFKCGCGNPVKVVSEDFVYHSCRRTSISYGQEGKPGETVENPYRRVKLDPKVTGGLEKYGWFVEWS